VGQHVSVTICRHCSAGTKILIDKRCNYLLAEDCSEVKKQTG
jgi:hypothetical protein